MADIQAFLERANMLIEQGRPKEAETWVKKVLEQEPENDYALSILARSYMNGKEYDKGIETVNKAIAIDPEESHYFYLLGFAYYQKSDHLIAITNLNKAIELDPYQASYFGLLAFIYLEENQFELALAKANEGLEVDPEDITCLNARSKAQNKLKMTDEAIATMQNALEKDPDNEFTHATIGWNLLDKGKHKEANRHFREALRIDPNYESARVGLKESLKSDFLPYKWVVLFGSWMSEKSKNFQWIFYIGIYLLVRFIGSIAAENDTLKPFLLPLVVFYFLFIFFTWIANPVANFFLLFHRDGKYSLTKAESIIGVSVIVTLLLGILIGCYAFYFFKDTPDDILFPAIILTTMAIPIGQLELPLHFKGAGFRKLYPFLLIVAGLLAIPMIFLNKELGILFTVTYGIGLLIYTWIAHR